MLAHLFAQSAQAYPNRPAICVESEIQTYAALEAAAGQICTCLRTSAATSPGAVILATSRTFAGFAGVLGVLGAGMTYVPVAPATPGERARSIAAATVPSAIIADHASFRIAELIARSAAHPLIIVLPEHESCEVDRHALAPHKVYFKSELRRLPSEFEPADTNPASLAYILFTSGTTGEPKGVPIRQESVVQYVRSMASLYPLHPTDRCTQLFDLTFDLSVHDMFVTWYAGACLFVPHRGRALFAADLVERHRLTVWFSVPSVVSKLARSRKLDPNALQSLRLAFFCGERLPIQVAKAMKTAAPEALLINTYGPTEATVAFTHYAWDGADLPELCQDLPIGHALPEQHVFLLDSDRQPAPPGAVGEIYLAGSQVATEYWNNPKETVARFHNISLNGKASQRVYATADLAVEVPGLGFIFRGRIDEQVKLNGVRIELGAIEAAVRRAAAGQQAAALVWPPDYPTRLIVYVEKGDATVAEIFKKCHSLLSHNEQPHDIFEIGRLPLTHNGKLDRKALVALYRQRINTPSVKLRFLPTTTDIEVAVHEILSQRRSPSTAPLPDMKPDEDLFNHTDSLGFVEMILELEEKFAITIKDWQAVTRLDKLVHNVLKAGSCSTGSPIEVGCNIPAETHSAPQLQRGLRNVVLDYSSISEIDGKSGFLAYCGIPVNQLVNQRYIDVVFLLMHGHYPTNNERAFVLAQFQTGQQCKEKMERLMDAIAAACPSPIQFILSVVPLFRPLSISDEASHWPTALQLQGFVSSAICHHATLVRGVRKTRFTIEQSLPEWVLNGISGRLPSEIEKQTIESLFVLLAECITNPGTFAARIATSTEADYGSAVVAALAVFSGSKHGGATDDVMDMIADIGNPMYAADWVKTAQQEKRPVPGFGHRVFQVPDPRAQLLANWTQRLMKAGADSTPVEIMEKVIDAMTPRCRHGTHINVDAYTGTLLTMLGVPRGYGTVLFALARMAGWAAHVEEQKLNNIMINPLVSYRARQAHAGSTK